MAILMTILATKRIGGTLGSIEPYTRIHSFSRPPNGIHDARSRARLRHRRRHDGAVRLGPLRYDLVAAVALLAAIVVGIVPPDKAFSGFSDDIVIIVASALVVSAAVARSGVIERMLARSAPYLVTIHRQVVALVGSVTVLSAFVKNIGALAMLMPIAFQLARRTGTSPSSLY